ncbi:MAG: hypothetical protein ACTHZ5_16010 [Micrococcaceae bacterium]
MSSTFQIALVDGTSYTSGERHDPTFGQFPQARLESYAHEGDWLCLQYGGGCELEIPERRVAHIVTYPSPDAQ